MKSVVRSALCALTIAGVVGVGSAASALAAGDATSPSCPSSTEESPGFRGFLPNCRGYELVSPSFVGGQYPYGVGRRLPPISADGNHVLSLVYAAFAGTENLEEAFGEFGAIYEFSRTPTGWSAESLEPPASLYPRREFEMASADLSKSLWTVQLPEADGEELPVGATENGIIGFNDGILMLREDTGGGRARFVPVGPVAAPGHVATGNSKFGVAGASADLSDIFLQVEASEKQLWPGDQTDEGDESLYEYQGVEAREPILVGVKNEGALHGSPFVNEGAELISKCGTVLGSKGITALSNTISTDGEKVFFTAKECPGGPQADELWARVDNGGPTARSVAISEPTTGADGDCEACTESGERKPGFFEGASQDGSRVFFASEQALLPGSKGMSLYEYNFDAAEHERVRLVAPEVAGAGAVAAVSADGSHVYFQSEARYAGVGSNANGEVPVAGVSNLYVYEPEGEGGRGRVSFVAREAGGSFEVTSDGEYAVFTSARQLEGTNDTSENGAQLFEYDAATGRVDRVSEGQRAPDEAGCEGIHEIEVRYNCDGNTTNPAYAPLAPNKLNNGAGEKPTFATTGLSVASTGAVVFESRDALTPFSTPGGENVYVYENENVYLVSPGSEAISVKQLAGESRLLGISESGASIFFSTTESLVPQDTDTQASWYDAQIDGGFPAPLSPTSCSSATCQGSTTSQPSLPTAGGSALAAPAASENPVEPRSVISPNVTRSKPKTPARACKSKKASRTSKSKCRKNSPSSRKKAKKASAHASRRAI
jgi:hypothetical protein